MASDNEPINLIWDDSSFKRVLAALDQQVEELGLRMPNIRIVARALLVLLSQGANPTPRELIDYIGDNGPLNGWIGFSRTKWITYVTRVVHVLKSHRPNQILSST